MSTITSISDIFKTDEDGNYIKRNAKLARKIHSYLFVNQEVKSSTKYSESFYDNDLASWLLDNYKEFIDRYRHRPDNKMKRSNKIQNVPKRVKDLLNDLYKLDLIQVEKGEQRRGTTDIINVYKYTFAGYLIALLIEILESGKQASISSRIYNAFDSHFKENNSSYSIFYSSLFKKYMREGVFDEFLVNTLLYRLTSGIEITTINDLIASLDLLFLDDAKKAKHYVKILLETLNELDPNVKALLLYDLKLLLQKAIANSVEVYYKDFEESCFKFRENSNILILEGRCRSCQSFLLITCEIIHCIIRSNLFPHSPLIGVKCSECQQGNCIMLPRPKWEI